MGIPGVRSLVDQVKVWRVRSPFATVQAWLRAHPLRGLTIAGSAGPVSRAGQTIMTGTSYHGRGNRAWQSANLEISAAWVGPDSTAIRVDAMIVWLDPRPYPARPNAHPARVTLAGGCPHDDHGVTGVTNPGARLTHRLLPPGKPTAGLRCRYDGLNGHPWQLAATTKLTARTARRAARTITAIRLSHPDGETEYCPFGDDSAEILALAYPGRPDVDLWIYLNGCGGVSNGYIMAGGY